MVLTNEELKKLYKGACLFAESDGYLCAFHYSRAQINLMSSDSYDMDWRKRGMFSGGIRLELLTDATSISFNFRSNNSSEQNTIDLYINDTLSQIFKIEGIQRNNVSFSLCGGEKKVTIYLPIDCKLAIKDFEINGSYAPIRKKRKKVLLIGDSISQGYGPTYSGCAYVNALMRKANLDILNQGIGGYRFEPSDLMLVDGFNPDRIIVFLGTNYYEKECKELFNYDYEKSVKEFFEKLKELYGSIPVLCITPLWRNDNTNYERLEECTSIIKNECRKYENITVVDGFTLVPNVDMCFCDKLHPNEYGSEQLASNLAKIIKDIRF